MEGDGAGAGAGGAGAGAEASWVEVVGRRKKPSHLKALLLPVKDWA